jgi:uncharacterized membrane protein YfcA
MPELALLTLVGVLAYSFEIVFGLAGTIILLTVLSTVFDAKTLVIYSVLPQILVGVIGLARSPRTVEWRVLAGMLGFAVLGGIAGMAIFYSTPAVIFKLLLAGVITLFGVVLVTHPHLPAMPPVLARSLDTLAGASQALFGISGPIAMTRMLATWQDKTVVRNYALAFFLVLNVLRAGAYAAHQTFTPEILWMMAVSAPFLAASLWFTNALHFRVSSQQFRQVVAWAILVAGISLFFR